MKKLLFISVLLILCTMCKAQTQYVYNAYNKGAYILLVDSTHKDSFAYPKNTLIASLNGGAIPQLTLSSVYSVSQGYGTGYAMVVATWDNSNIYILAPNVDSGFRKLNNMIFNDTFVLQNYIQYGDTIGTIATKKNLQLYVPLSDTGSIIPTFADTFKTIATVKSLQPKVNFSDTTLTIATKKNLQAKINFSDTVSTIASQHYVSTHTTSASGTKGALQFSIGGTFSSTAALHYNSTFDQLFVTDSAGNGGITTGGLTLLDASTSAGYSFVYTGATNVVNILPNNNNAGVLTNDGSGNLSWATITLATDTFAATGGQTSFTLSNTPLGSGRGNLQMFIQGSYILPTYYTNSGTTVTYTGSIISAGNRVAFTYIHD